MSNYRKRVSQADSEIAIGDVRDAIAALRWLGFKTVAGIHRIAEHCHLAPRRIRTFFHRDQGFIVSAEERRYLALALADLFDQVADDCEAHAEKCRQKADAMRLRERDQLNLPLGGEQQWHGGHGQQRHRAAA